MKLCVPITAPSREGALRAIEEAAAAADMVELRMDAIGDVPLSSLLRKAKGVASPPAVVVTNRLWSEGGLRPIPNGESFEASERRRVGVLIEAVERGVEFVDVELATDERLRDSLREAIARRGFRTALMVSRHDFRRTPPLPRLKEILDRCGEAGASIAKIVTTAARPEDNLRILELIVHARRRENRIVAFCMGGAGRVSRLAAPLMGAEFGFACLREDEGSATGQLTVRQMRQGMKMLEAGRDKSA